jgi:hypothetical protein
MCSVWVSGAAMKTENTLFVAASNVPSGDHFPVKTLLGWEFLLFRWLFEDQNPCPSNLPRLPSLMQCLRFHKPPTLQCRFPSDVGRKQSPSGRSRSLMVKNVSSTAGLFICILSTFSDRYSWELQHLRPSVLTRHLSRTTKEHIESLSSTSPVHSWYWRGKATSQGWPL